jgi:cytochrome d ubiquinol oxidase subunit I
MTDAVLARAQMAMSLGFHIVFAAVGVVMPALMVIAEARWLWTRDRDYRDLARAWAKGTAVLFAIGAVSGTVLSFELGLLFPGLMSKAGALIGPGFALEGVAFFTEAVFLGIYLYGWERVKPALHLAAGGVVALSGVASAALVTLVNAWMQNPRGLRVDPATGAWLDLDPAIALLNPYAVHELLHSIPAYYLSAALCAAGVHALGLLRAPGNAFHRKALGIALAVATPAALVMPATGHLAGQRVAVFQPMKLAAMESQFETQRGAPLRLGGIPDEEARVTRFALELPGGLSFLATNDLDGLVLGLEEFPREDWPHPVVHYAFQVMVGIGTALAALLAFGLFARVRRGAWPEHRRFLQAVIVGGPLAFVALEAGWVVAEVGRQPWTAYGLLRTKDLVTPMPNLIVPFLTITFMYLFLAAAVVFVLRRIFGASPGLGADP